MNILNLVLSTQTFLKTDRRRFLNTKVPWIVYLKGKSISPLLRQSQNVLHVIMMWPVTLIKSNILTFGLMKKIPKYSLWLLPSGIDLKPKNKTIISPPFVIR